ncbi:zinc finger, C2H2 type [Ancylostoma ceylanicum]|uniref:Zinc finger, C2H2 type n=1 Tax=Ancylostoma ceylanicum TaxID=53326 RepID=A0A0D6M1F5_9BILA|nr:zinc finger, C2H2 type [Ancylostoma ceylanicum]
MKGYHVNYWVQSAMYGYSQGNYGNYGSAYTAAAAAAAVYGNLGVGQSTQAQQQSNSVFGNSVAASYGYGNQSTNAASVYAAQAAQAQVQASQVSRLSADAAYAAAAGVAPSQYSAFGAGQLAGFGSTQANAGATVGYGRPSASATNQAAKSLAALTNSSNKSALAVNSSSTYSNYDAAVYAAASSYLHSKATGTTNMWMSKKPGGVGRGGGFANKRFGAGAGTQKEAQQFYCEVCKISCAGQLTYKEHLEGQRHKKKEALAKGENNPSLPKSKVSFRCDLCNVTCTGQDTYNAHVRGAKHQKTLTLCKKLGKPIPSTEPTIIPPSEMGGVIPPPPATTSAAATAGANNSAKRVVGISTVNFVAGAKLSSTAGQLEAKKQQVMQAVGSAGTKAPEDSTVQAIKGQTEELQALIAAEQNLKPVGEEFVEAQRDATGKLLQYLCKLCDCKFSDPNAKEIHLKGRRHRLQYKMKAKHTSIYPDDEQLTVIERLVTETEKALKKVSDYFNERDHLETKPQIKAAAAGESAKDTAVQEKDRLLKGVMRVGMLSKGLLLKDDTEVDNSIIFRRIAPMSWEYNGLIVMLVQVHLVVLCSHIPGLSLLKEVATLIPKYYESPEGSSINITVEESTSSMILQQSSVPLRCRISLTSREFREDAAGGWFRFHSS